MPSVVLAWLIIFSATVLTLEIQHQLLLARMLGAIVMLIAWQCLLPSALQLKAASCAIVYHGIAEGLRQWQRNFPCVFEHRKDRKVILWLLFWARVFIWGAAIGGVAVFVTLLRDPEETRTNPLSCWQETAALALYYEVVEVLVMLYFSDKPLPYLWHKRIGHWLAALFVGFLETTGRLDTVLRSSLLVEMSPLALVVVLLMVMWLSIEIPWDQIAEASSPCLAEEEEHDEMEESERNREVAKYPSSFSGVNYISGLFRG
ncbi:unnamed protein product [Peronospora belbahrii]|uniref:Uncharacterized protein n=1 Tax=Peronospora belbahrii TaxID=622444 RepID=A0AAU9KHT0_9STRA|nr:unnamed protein product [Peronospora belbahrii]CAH0517619.1 unnamed protein product [Peronospora belbahrii]